jgi:hypothetical protein
MKKKPWCLGKSIDCIARREREEFMGVTEYELHGNGWGFIDITERWLGEGLANVPFFFSL